MSRIQMAFDQAKAEHRGTLIIYVCSGDPSLDATVDIVLAAEQGGADIVELGIPYSDPLADGPVIQQAGQRALNAGTTVAGVLDAATRIRQRSEVPLVVMTCFNPILQFGPERFARAAAAAGVDAVLASDLPPEESDEWVEICRENGMGTVFLVAPTTRDGRLGDVTAHSTAFVYVVSRPGTTGVRADLPEDMPHVVQRVRNKTDKPVVVGFGVSSPEQVRAVCAVADGAVVGSAVVRLIASQTDQAAIAPAVRQFVSQLSEGKMHT